LRLSCVSVGAITAPDACLDDLNVSSHSPPIIEQVYFTGDEQRAARLTPLVQECFGPEFTVQYSGLEADSRHFNAILTTFLCYFNPIETPF
jgi:hypothetical protein